MQPPPNQGLAPKPPYYLRRTRWWRLASWVSLPCVFAVCTLVYLRLFFRLDLPAWPYMVVGLMPLLVYVLLRALPHVRIQREFTAARGRLCTACGYDLHNQPETGVCPECGGGFDARRDAQSWCRVGIMVPYAADPPPSPSG